VNRIIVPIAAVVGLLAANGLLVPCLAQSAGLPQTVMGKFVHMPGDNQYSNSTQATRHGPPPQVFVPQQNQVANAGYTAPAWAPTPRPFRPDPSIEPIAADEPVSPQGFPPLPDRLDLPVALSWTSGGPGGGGAGGGYGGGYGGGSGGGGGSRVIGPTDASGQLIDSSPQGMHQHYQHYSPGAFMPPQAHQSAPAAPPQHSGYYKCTTPEQFSSGGAPAGAAAAPADPNMQALRGLGKEPKLSDRNDQQQAAPEAPQAVVVGQATTQDLSLPEDEFQQKSPPSRNSGSNVLKRVGQMTMQRGMSMGQMMMSRGMAF